MMVRVVTILWEIISRMPLIIKLLGQKSGQNGQNFTNFDACFGIKFGSCKLTETI